VKDELREILKKGQELTNAKFTKVKEDWWRNVLAKIRALPTLKMAREKTRIAYEKLKEFRAKNERRMNALIRNYDPAQGELVYEQYRLKNELREAEEREKTIRWERRPEKDKQKLIKEAREQWESIKRYTSRRSKPSKK
jgi:hypothetical protein